MTDLKRLRQEKKITQKQAAELTGISLRSYKSYENDSEKAETIKYKYLYQTLMDYCRIDEEHGIIEVNDIIDKCAKVFERYEVYFCYLFGSYAKGMANPKSDVDLIISANISGLKFFGLVEELREVLHKKVEVLSIDQLKDNHELVVEVLKDGIKIYG